MSKRYKLPAKSSRKMFTRTAKSVHGKNVSGMPMRGGIRL